MTWLEVSVDPNSYSSIPSHIVKYFQDETTISTPLSTFYQPSVVKKLSIYVNAATGETLVKPPINAHVKYLSECLWWELYDKRSHHLFYFNPLLKQSIWKKPQNGDIINLVHIQMAGENILECVLKDIIISEASIDEALLSDIDMGIHNGRKSLRTSLEISSNDDHLNDLTGHGTLVTSSSSNVQCGLPFSSSLTSHHYENTFNDVFSYTGENTVTLSDKSEDATLKSKESRPMEKNKVNESDHLMESNGLDLKVVSSSVSYSSPATNSTFITSTALLSTSSGKLHQQSHEMWFSSLDSGIPPDLSYTPATTLSSCCTQEEVEQDAEIGGEEEEEEERGADPEDNCMDSSALASFPSPQQTNHSPSLHNHNSLTSSCASFVGDSASCPLQRKSLRLTTSKVLSEKVDVEEVEINKAEDSPIDDPWILQDCVMLRNSRNTSEWPSERQACGNMKVSKTAHSRTSQGSTVTHGSLSLLMDTVITSPSSQTLQHSRGNNDHFHLNGSDCSHTPSKDALTGSSDKNMGTFPIPHPHKSSVPYKRSESCRTALPFFSHLRRRKTSSTRGDISSVPSSQPSRTMPNSPLHHNTTSSTVGPVASRSAESITNTQRQTAPSVFTISILSPSSPNGMKTLTVQPCWHRSLLRSDQSMRKLLTWSKEPLTSPILLQTKKTFRKSACEVFRLIQMYMADRKRNSRQTSGHNTGDLELIQQIMERGQQNPNLKDEILVQLCKQTTRNPNETSLKRGWELLCICLTYWTPSTTIFPYILGYVLTNQSHNHPSSPENTDKMEEFLFSRDLITLYAVAAEERLLFPPSTEGSTALPVLQMIAGNGDAYASSTHPRLRPSRSLSASEINLDELELTRQYLPSLRPFRSSLEQCICLSSPDFSPSISAYEGVPWILPFLLKLVVHFNGLNTEGLFRNSGDMDAVCQLRRYCEKVLCPLKENSHITNSMSLEFSQRSGIHELGFSEEVLLLCHNDPDVPANVLKQWLRELSPPLLTPLQSLEKMQNSHLSIEQLCCIVKHGRLPSTEHLLEEGDDISDLHDNEQPQLSLFQRQTLILLLAFLKVVCQQPYVTKNRMICGSLAIVLAPNLFQPCELFNYNDGMNDKSFQLHQMDRHKAIVELLINHADTSGVDLTPILCHISHPSSSSIAASSDVS